MSKLSLKIYIERIGTEGVCYILPSSTVKTLNGHIVYKVYIVTYYGRVLASVYRSR